jgi:hypothetical protein
MAWTGVPSKTVSAVSARVPGADGKEADKLEEQLYTGLDGGCAN